MVLSLIEIEDLILAAESPAAFRRAALANYRAICLALATAEHRAPRRQGPVPPLNEKGEIRPWKERVNRLIRPLMTQPNFRAFARAYETAIEELTWRDDENPDLRRRTIAHFQASPGKAIIATALVTLRHRNPGKNPTATALASALSMSRPALYRAFGAKTIQAALNTIRKRRGGDPWRKENEEGAIAAGACAYAWPATVRRRRQPKSAPAPRVSSSIPQAQGQR